MENKENFDFNKIGNAILSFLVLLLALFFILPWSIWIAATRRLDNFFKNGIILNLSKSEAPFINWLILFFDSLIFISYIIGVIGFFGILGYKVEHLDQEEIWKTAFGFLFIAYFIPLFLSLTKEFLFVLPFGKYLKLEEIAFNTNNLTSKATDSTTKSFQNIVSSSSENFTKLVDKDPNFELGGVPKLIKNLSHLTFLKQKQKSLNDNTLNYQFNRKLNLLKNLIYWGIAAVFICIFLMFNQDFFINFVFSEYNNIKFNDIERLIPIKILGFLKFLNNAIIYLLVIIYFSYVIYLCHYIFKNIKYEKKQINILNYSLLYIPSIVLLSLLINQNINVIYYILYGLNSVLKNYIPIFFNSFHIVLIMVVIVLYNLIQSPNKIFSTPVAKNLYWLHIGYLLIYVEVILVCMIPQIFTTAFNVDGVDIFEFIIKYSFLLYYFASLYFIIMTLILWRKLINELVKKMQFEPIEMETSVNITSVKSKPILNIQEKTQILSQLDNIHNLYVKGVINLDTYNQMKASLVKQLEDSAKNEKENLETNQKFATSSSIPTTLSPKAASYNITFNNEKNQSNNPNLISTLIFIVFILFVFIGIYISFYFVYKPDPIETAQISALNYCNCSEKKYKDLININQDFLLSFNSKNFDNEQEALDKLAASLNPIYDKFTECENAANIEKEKFRNFFVKNQEQLILFDNSFEIAENKCNSSKKDKIISNLQTKINEKISTIIELPEMVYVEGGTFKMGCTREQRSFWFSSCNENENPEHEVSLNSFYIAKFEVTQKLFQKIMGYNPSKFTNCENCPIESVSWQVSQEFITKLNLETGKNYRLPTEAEWEYAARGGNLSKGYKFSGSNYLSDVAWFKDNSNNTKHSNGIKKPNELGIYDMSGNVGEWCSDWYGANYYSNSTQNNPTGENGGEYRVWRGGSWFNIEDRCRVSSRLQSEPNGLYSNIGLRLVLEP